MNWHWHNELHYCLVVEGPVTFSVDHSEYTLAAGSGILINARPSRIWQDPAAREKGLSLF